MGRTRCLLPRLSRAIRQSGRGQNPILTFVLQHSEIIGPRPPVRHQSDHRTSLNAACVWGRLCSVVGALEGLQHGAAKFGLSLFNYHFAIATPLPPLSDESVHFSLRGNELFS